MKCFGGCERLDILHALQDVYGLKVCNCDECGGDTAWETLPARLWEASRVVGSDVDHPVRRWLRDKGVGSLYPAEWPLPDSVRWLDAGDYELLRNWREGVHRGAGCAIVRLGSFPGKTDGGVSTVHLRANGRPCYDSISQIWTDGEGQQQVRQAVQKNSFGQLANHLGWLGSGTERGLVHIVKGLADGLHLAQYCRDEDVAACVFTALSAKRVAGVSEALKAYRGVVLWPDGDEFGQRQGRKALNALRARKIRGRIQALPEGLDPADCSADRIKRWVGELDSGY